MGTQLPEQREIHASSSPKSSYATTRRALIAAAGVFGAALAAKKAYAMALPPQQQDGGTNCFLSGTCIRTPKGEVEVDDLAVGDLVDTIGGAAKPIKWIGRRLLERSHGQGWPSDTLPVKVARSAFGALVPHTDLFLSPAHAVYVDGLLVPVTNLINGRSIVRCSGSDFETIEYFHFELDTHDVIFAEGAPTETLLAIGDRAFDNWVMDDGFVPAQPFAPRVPVLGRRADVRSKLRSAVSPWIDRRQPIDVIWDRFAERAEIQIAA
jgi:Hint domain